MFILLRADGEDIKGVSMGRCFAVKWYFHVRGGDVKQFDVLDGVFMSTKRSTHIEM